LLSFRFYCVENSKIVTNKWYLKYCFWSVTFLRQR
ncbi:leucine efflux protein LeuE, partial [Salmonella enterica subsp. enterica serovar Saintpaul]|nr:leucine efflux protein LeuE [Salmonella enterica subsp. enterica serovar Typhimurium]EDS4963262.1 leucine efflux protein LeuE [Salmonella enterica subsp. enterica serovar Saintpaul]